MEINLEYLEKELKSKQDMKNQAEAVVIQLVGQIKLLENLLKKLKEQK